MADTRKPLTPAEIMARPGWGAGVLSLPWTGRSLAVLAAVMRGERVLHLVEDDDE